MNRRTRRTQREFRVRRRTGQAALQAFATQSRLYKLSWFKAPLQPLTATRVAEIYDLPKALVPGTYAWAKQAAEESAADWAIRELHRPGSPLNHRTVRICGKPYHWRQDYTGQLKLAAGESPW